MESGAAFGDQIVVSKTMWSPRRLPDGTQCSGDSESGTAPIERFGAEAERTLRTAEQNQKAPGELAVSGFAPPFGLDSRRH